MKQVLFLSLTLASFLIPCIAQEKNFRKDDFDKMRFEAVLDKNSYLQSEPAFVEFTFSNPTLMPLITYEPDFIKESKLKISFKGKTSTFDFPSSVSGPGIRFSGAFQPNKSLKGEGVISSAFAGYFFPENGKYQIQFILRSSDGAKFLESNVINLEIKIPEGINKDAVDFLNEHKDFFFLSSWSPNNKQQEDLLEKFVAKFGQSVYGELAIIDLGYFYLSKSEFDKAQREFEKLKISRNSLISKEANRALDDITQKRIALGKER